MSVELDRPYCTLLDVQTETKNNDASKADVLSAAINLASRAVEDFCLRDFWRHDHSTAALVVKRDWVDGDLITLPWPVVQVDAVLEGGTALAAGFYHADTGECFLERLVPITGLDALFASLAMDYQSDLQALQRGRVYNWHEIAKRGLLTVKGVFGYTLADTDPTKKPPVDLPAQVRRACTLLAANWSGQNRKEQVNFTGEKISILDTTTPKEVPMLLKRWRRGVL